MMAKFVCFISRWLLSCRYKVSLNSSTLNKVKIRGVLILPNHPAYTDPMIVFSWLYRWFSPRPLVYESYYQNPLFYPFMVLVHALEVKDVQKSDFQPGVHVKKTIQTMVESLKNGQNIILWPSGTLQNQATEKLGGNSAVYEIIQQYPEVKICLIRTKGLWGSRFSHAFHGRQPALVKEMFRSFGWILFNLFFFMPKRKVQLDFHSMEGVDFKGLKKTELNKFIESWFNTDLPSDPVYRPYHFLDIRKTRSYPSIQIRKTNQVTDFPPELIAKVRDCMNQILGSGAPSESIQLQDKLSDLGLDSLQRMELLSLVEKEFSRRSGELPETFGDLCAVASGRNIGKVEFQVPDLWWKTKDGREGILGETILKAFLERVKEDPNRLAMMDDLAGMITYRKALLAGLVLSSLLKKDKSTYVGIMLPATAGAFLSYFAVLLAGKIPVLLNWTTGHKNLTHGISMLGITQILTSGRFLEKIGVKLDTEKLLLLEDAKKNVSLARKLKSLILSRFPWLISTSENIHALPDTTAAVLFTSGSEKDPKAVPLTHKNIIFNQRDGLKFLGLKRKDSIVAFLPPFHSFGLSVTGIMPILSGMKIAFHADPTDVGPIGSKLFFLSVSVLIGTPTFVRKILEKIGTEKLTNLRLVITGAEKCPQSVMDIARQVAPNAVFLEGYGITECSPVVAVNPPAAPRNASIGLPLPAVKIKIRRLDDSTECVAGEMGMLYIAGPTVFSGYLSQNAPHPFVQIDGLNWYQTGDLVHQDADGYLYFGGRMKRFIKVGGEMVSLPALEEVFAIEFPPDENGPTVAVEGIEKEHGKCIALFTRKPVDVIKANQLLSQNGLTGIARVDRVVSVETIPILGTGKTDYKALKKLLESEL